MFRRVKTTVAVYVVNAARRRRLNYCAPSMIAHDFDYENSSHHTFIFLCNTTSSEFQSSTNTYHSTILPSALSKSPSIIRPHSAIHAASTTRVSPIPDISRYMTATSADSGWLQPRIPSLRGVCGASPGPVACPTPHQHTPSTHRQPSSATSSLPSSPHSKIPSSSPRV